MNNTLDILPHNKRASKRIQEKFKQDNVAAAVHATGTGKNYIFLDIAMQYPDKKFLFFAPSAGIIEQVQEIIKENNLDLNNIEFRTYQSLVNMSDDELSNLEADYLVLDEFHHIGAPIWGYRIQKIIETHENIKVLGLSAYTVRNRGRETENDIASPYTNELFSGNVVSTYTLSSAILDKVLPLPKYKSAYVDYPDEIEAIEKRLSKLKKGSAIYKDVHALLTKLNKKIADAKNASDVFKENIKPDGKYIYFCPVNRNGKEENDIEYIKNQVKGWVESMGLTEDDYVFYETTDEMGSLGKKNRDAFYHDKDLNGNDCKNKLRIMFAINQYNEGVHAPNVDGVIMGRDTKSDIVFYEQLGRALSVISEEAVVIDLAGNIDYMYSLQDKINKELSKRKKKNPSDKEPKEEKEDNNFEFNMGLMNVDILDIIKEIEARLGMGFYDNYALAKNYYEKNGNLLIPANFSTFDGVTYQEDGIQLGQWIRTIRKTFSEGKLPMDKVRLLNKIGMVWENINIEQRWLDNYKLASDFYNFYGNLEVPSRFKTKDGIHFDEEGCNLGTWVKTQRTAYQGNTAHKITPAKITLLNNIGMRWDKIDKIAIWKSKYFYAKQYYLEHGDLNVPDDYKCDGNFNLKVWLKNQKSNAENLTEEQIDLLDDIYFSLEKKDYVAMWNYKFSIYQRFVDFYGRVDVPSGFRTLDGIHYSDNGVYLDVWYNYQFKRFEKGILDDTQKELLEGLGVEFTYTEDEKKGAR